MRVKDEQATIINAAKAELRLIVWCRSCGHQVEPGSDFIGAMIDGARLAASW